MPPCSNAADAVITLAVEPGVNSAWSGRSVASAAAVSVFWSQVGHWAMARMSPVCGCMMTTVHDLACALSTSFWHAFIASYCRAGLIVSLIDSPFLAGVSSLLPGICSPSAPCSNCSLPLVPVSSLLYSCSMPAWPAITSVLWLTLVNPTTLAVASPSGYLRT